MFSEEQIIAILKQAEAGVSVPDLCQQHGINGKTFFHWRAKYDGMESKNSRRIQQLEDENRKLKRLVAKQLVDLMELKNSLEKTRAYYALRIRQKI